MASRHPPPVSRLLALDSRPSTSVCYGGVQTKVTLTDTYRGPVGTGTLELELGWLIQKSQYYLFRVNLNRVFRLERFVSGPEYLLGWATGLGVTGALILFILSRLNLTKGAIELFLGRFGPPTGWILLILAAVCVVLFFLGRRAVLRLYLDVNQNVEFSGSRTAVANLEQFIWAYLSEISKRRGDFSTPSSTTTGVFPPNK